MDLQNNNGQATGLSLLGGRGVHDFSLNVDELTDRVKDNEDHIDGLDEVVQNLGGRVNGVENDVRDLQAYAGEGLHADSHLVHIDGVQTITGAKTFSSQIGAGAGINITGDLEVSGDLSVGVVGGAAKEVLINGALEITGGENTGLMVANGGEVVTPTLMVNTIKADVAIGTVIDVTNDISVPNLSVTDGADITGNFVSSGTNASITGTSTAGVTGEVVTLTSGTSGNQTKLQMTDNLVKIGLTGSPNNLEVIGEVICATDPTTDDNLTRRGWVNGAISTAITELLDGASDGYDTLVELERQLTSEDGVVAGLLTQIGGKVSKDGDTMSGTLNITGGNVGLNVNSTTHGGTHIGGTQTSNYLSSAGGTVIRKYNSPGYTDIARFFTDGIELKEDTEITGNLYVSGSSTANQILSSATALGTHINSPTGYNQLSSGRSATANWIRSTGSGYNNIQANTGYNLIQTTGENGRNIIACSSTGYNLMRVGTEEKIKLDEETTTITNDSVVVAGNLNVSGGTYVDGNILTKSAIYNSMTGFGGDAQPSIHLLKTSGVGGGIVMRATYGENDNVQVTQAPKLDFYTRRLNADTLRMTLSETGLALTNDLVVGGNIHGQGNGDLDLYRNTGSYDSESWVQMKGDKLALGGPYIQLFTGSSDAGWGNERVRIEQNKIELKADTDVKGDLVVEGNVNGDLTVVDGNLIIEHSDAAEFDPYIVLNSRKTSQVYDGVSSLFLTEQFFDRTHLQGAYVEYDGDNNALKIGTQNAGSSTSASTKTNAITIVRGSDNVHIDGDVSVGGVYKKANIPLITQTWGFYQPELGFFSGKYLIHAPIRDNDKDGVTGMVCPVSIMPYAISVAVEDADSGSSHDSGVVTFDVRCIDYTDPANSGYMARSDLQDYHDYTMTRGTGAISTAKDKTSYVVLDNPNSIPAGTPFGIRFTESITFFSSEITVKLFCSQA